MVDVQQGLLARCMGTEHVGLGVVDEEHPIGWFAEPVHGQLVDGGVGLAVPPRWRVRPGRNPRP